MSLSGFSLVIAERCTIMLNSAMSGSFLLLLLQQQQYQHQVAVTSQCGKAVF
jgi:hypothetical protein